MSQELPYAAEIRKCADSDSSNLLSGLKAISKLINPAADVDRVDEEIARLTKLIASKSPSLEGILRVLSDEGFRGIEGKSANSYANCDIDHLLQTHQGIPLTMSLLIMEVSRHLDVANFGINFPAKFLVKLENDVVDPIDLRVVDYAKLVA